MTIDCIEVGPLRSNCYLIEKSGEYLLIDPGEDYEKILNFIKGKNILGILITHHHLDHTGSVEKLVETFGYPVYQFDNLQERMFSIGPFSLEIILTPGHSEDSITFYFKNEGIMFTGDFLFYDTIGRCDLEGGSEQEMVESIQKIKQYPSDIVVYPGHGISTTLGREVCNNIYFR